MIQACDAITLIDSDEVDQLLNRLTTKEILTLISIDSPLDVIDTEDGQRWDKDAIEAAIANVKTQCRPALPRTV